MQAYFDLGSERSGIDKRPVNGRVRLAQDAVEGDVVVDRVHHGGPDKAVYAYACEDAQWWAAVIGEPIAPGRFGENLSTLGIDLSGSIIGSLWRVGSALLQVCQPRIPCKTFSGFWQRPSLVKEFTAAARPGVYLRILEEGDVGAGDGIEIVAIPDHDVRIAEAFRARLGERSLVSRINAATALPPAWHEWATKALADEPA